MNTHEITDAWFDKISEASKAGPGALRVVETHLLAAMLEAERYKRQADELRAKLAPPDPARGLTRAHGLHLLNETGKLIPVDVDYSVDEDEGIQVQYIWIGCHDVAGMFWASHAELLADQIAKRIKEDAAEQRAESRKELRDAA
jgi:hypothetical protein